MGDSSWLQESVPRVEEPPGLGHGHGHGLAAQEEMRTESDELQLVVNFLENLINESNLSTPIGSASSPVLTRKPSTIVGNHDLKAGDIECEILDWLLHHLESRKCPYSLSLALASTVAKQASEKLQNCLDNFPLPVTSSGDLYRQSLLLLNELCLNWRENPKQAVEEANKHSVALLSSTCAIKNGRRKMEDRHVVFHDLNLLFDLKTRKQYSYYAVFDGHAGVDAATYCASHLHRNIVGSQSFVEGDIKDAIKEAFAVTDLHYLERSARHDIKSGCTVVCCLMEGKEKLYLAWLGDSQAILVKNGKPFDVTRPHKPEREDERERIEELGGVVVCVDTWRVNGTLAVSRAIGDPEHKPYVCSDPDVEEILLKGDEDFVILACDGLWDQTTPEEATTIVYEHLAEHAESDPVEAAKIVAQVLVDNAKKEGSTDNITTIVLFLKDIPSILSTPFTPPSPKERYLNEETDANVNGHNGAHMNPFTFESPYEFWGKNELTSVSATEKEVNGNSKYLLNNSNFDVGDLPTPPIDEMVADVSQTKTDASGEHTSFFSCTESSHSEAVDNVSSDYLPHEHRDESLTPVQLEAPYIADFRPCGASIHSHLNAEETEDSVIALNVEEELESEVVKILSDDEDNNPFERKDFSSEFYGQVNNNETKPKNSTPIEELEEPCDAEQPTEVMSWTEGLVEISTQKEEKIVDSVAENEPLGPSEVHYDAVATDTVEAPLEVKQWETESAQSCDLSELKESDIATEFGSVSLLEGKEIPNTLEVDALDDFVGQQLEAAVDTKIVSFEKDTELNGHHEDQMDLDSQLNGEAISEQINSQTLDHKQDVNIFEEKVVESIHEASILDQETSEQVNQVLIPVDVSAESNALSEDFVEEVNKVGETAEQPSFETDKSFDLLDMDKVECSLIPSGEVGSTPKTSEPNEISAAFSSNDTFGSENSDNQSEVTGDTVVLNEEFSKSFVNQVQNNEEVETNLFETTSDFSSLQLIDDHMLNESVPESEQVNGHHDMNSLVQIQNGFSEHKQPEALALALEQELVNDVVEESAVKFQEKVELQEVPKVEALVDKVIPLVVEMEKKTERPEKPKDLRTEIAEQEILDKALELKQAKAGAKEAAAQQAKEVASAKKEGMKRTLASKSATSLASKTTARASPEKTKAPPKTTSSLSSRSPVTGSKIDAKPKTAPAKPATGQITKSIAPKIGAAPKTIAGTKSVAAAAATNGVKPVASRVNGTGLRTNVSASRLNTTASRPIAAAAAAKPKAADTKLAKETVPMKPKVTTRVLPSVPGATRGTLSTKTATTTSGSSLTGRPRAAAAAPTAGVPKKAVAKKSETEPKKPSTSRPPASRVVPEQNKPGLKPTTVGSRLTAVSKTAAAPKRPETRLAKGAPGSAAASSTIIPIAKAAPKPIPSNSAEDKM